MSAGWEQQQDNEAQRFEEEQRLLTADPDYLAWLDFLDAKTKQERDDEPTHSH